MTVEKLGMVLYPVEDLDKALAFYQQALGLALKFRDGDRFCALDAGGATLALATGDERVSSAPCASLKVDDVDDVVARLSAAGATIERPAEDGPHERRAVLRDPAGNPLVIYGPLAG
jgi:predicted enzyme related to lactoylglutathione lyase